MPQWAALGASAVPVSGGGRLRPVEVRIEQDVEVFTRPGVTFAARHRHREALLQACHRTCTVADRALDIFLGNVVADADVHSGFIDYERES
jgi:hypothetical protein